MIQGISYVKRAIGIQEQYFSKSAESCLSLKNRRVVDTEGSSILELVKVPGIEKSTARTTNVLEICDVLGISAAVGILQAELHKTISFDSA